MLLAGMIDCPGVFALELVGENDSLACAEATALGPAVRRFAPGIALADSHPDRFEDLALTRSVLAVVGRAEASVDAAGGVLESAPLPVEGSAAVRARAIRDSTVSTQRAERELGAVLVENGMSVDLEDPDRALRVLFAGERSVMGWVVTEPDDTFAARRPTRRPFFQPGSMGPRLARAIVNLTGIDRGDRLFDPMCGTGGALVEAARMGMTVIGSDVQRRMVAGTGRNLAAAAPSARNHRFLADAATPPLPADSVDAVVVDVPYGRQSPLAGADRADLAAAVLSAARRVADRAVVVADRSLSGLARDRGWDIHGVFVQRVHRSLDRYIHVLHAAG